MSPDEIHRVADHTANAELDKIARETLELCRKRGGTLPQHIQDYFYGTPDKKASARQLMYDFLYQKAARMMNNGENMGQYNTILRLLKTSDVGFKIRDKGVSSLKSQSASIFKSLFKR